LQVTAVFLKNHIVPSMSLNVICCLMPAWFGAVSSSFVGLMAYEAAYSAELSRKRPSRSAALECGIVSAGIMAVVPAHLMRSIGGGFDNESLAFTTMTGTYYLWCRSIRNEKSWPVGILAGIMYYYMVAVWGGYIFVLNMVGCHAGVLVLLGRYSTGVYRSYSLFYFIGTFLAIYTIPVVGWTPLKSLEQMGPLVVFLGYQLIELCEIIKRKKKLKWRQAWGLRVVVFTLGLVFAIGAVYLLAPSGYFGPLSARVRGLLVKHTRTGNPLVDSVAEHQPANSSQYFQYLDIICYIAPFGLALCIYEFTNASSFLLLYALISYYFSSKMVRLIILLGPGMSAVSGILIGRFTSWSVNQFVPVSKVVMNFSKKKPSKKNKKKNETSKLEDRVRTIYSSNTGVFFRRVTACGVFAALYMFYPPFVATCEKMAHALSHPSIMYKAQTSKGDIVLVDDYREAYWWLKKNTPEDSRVLAWWDYGYQLAGIANRTTIADGNTWNHEHIALLARALTHTEKEGYRVARHLADYILVWGGGGGDDLAKSPHLARIANSVYRDMCPGDPTCRAFGYIDRYGNPSPMMEASMLYKLHSHGLKPGVQADPNRFKHVFDSKYGKVRIFKVLNVAKDSRDFVADPKNRICDVEGGWFCRGQYPPGLGKVLSQAKTFSQLEDFNKKRKSAGDKEDDEYTKKYFENMADPARAKKEAMKKAQYEQKKKELENKQKGKEEKTSEKKDDVKVTKVKNVGTDSAKWADTEETTLLWQIISQKDVSRLKDVLDEDPNLAFVRSSDGRGPMWWAYEFKSEAIVKLLLKKGVNFREKDKYGKTPLDLIKN